MRRAAPEPTVTSPSPATIKLKLIEFVRANGGDCDKVEAEISVTCKQRMEGNTEGGIDYYFHSSDGKRYRSNKEVCKKFLGISDFVSPPKKAKTTPKAK